MPVSRLRSFAVRRQQERQDFDMHVILSLLGILCFVYFIIIAFFAGHGTNFYFIWLILGLSLFIGSILLKRGIWAGYLPAWLRHFLIVLICVGGLLFIFVEGCILSGFTEKGPKNLDYLVILGAQMKAGGPSKALQYRLDKACLYLEENPDTKVIVSGGQGPDEHVSEAQGMQDYLLQKGIAQERIIMEDKSENTFQNLIFSAELLDKNTDTVGVVTNNFHIFRAVRIAKKTGYGYVYGIAAKGEPFLQFNNMMREFFGVIKDFVVGNM